ncbi:MAG TPA: energy transducer TonB [Gammaproteobacteria bacterium]|nr:energy transducer TonB [Gammaproteobacteria bacterium]
MRTLITTALIGGVLALAVTTALAQTAASAPPTATNTGHRASNPAHSSGGTNGTPPASGANAVREVPVSATMPAPAAASTVEVQLVSAASKFYPREALLRGIGGCVVLSMFISASGHPIVMSAAFAEPPGVFDAAALEAASGFRYQVTDVAGGPVDAETLPRGVNIQEPILYFIEGDGDWADWLCGLPLPHTLIVSPATAGAPDAIGIVSRDRQSPSTMLSDMIGSERAILLQPQLMAHDLVTLPVPAGQTLTSGWVKVSFCIGTDGRVANPRVTDASPRGLYDQAAIAALSTWQFSPRKRNGRNVRVCKLTYTIPVIARRDLERGPVAVQAASTVVNLHSGSDDSRRQDYIPGGKVVTRFCVEANGSLSHIEALKPQLPNPLAVAAVDVLESFQYWPRQIDGKWVRTCNIEQTLQFSGGRSLLSVHG